MSFVSKKVMVVTCVALVSFVIGVYKSNISTESAPNGSVTDFDKKQANVIDSNHDEKPVASLVQTEKNKSNGNDNSSADLDDAINASGNINQSSVGNDLGLQEDPAEFVDDNGDYRDSSDFEMAYAEEPGLELNFTDASLEEDSSQFAKEQELILDNQVQAYEAEIEYVRSMALESVEPEEKKQAVERLINYDGMQATQALVDFIFDTTDEHRIVATEGLIKKLHNEGSDQQLIIDTLTVLMGDWDGSVAMAAQEAIDSLQTEQ
ncbi:hypothetical protein [Pleionea sediminis]|uniref:hypothetical protein n=1 Tax=Pleionea sediminis TaxID=2569479 RepID=UPI001184E059|nr:hypothetical protein [Pleionea sediminis]